MQAVILSVLCDGLNWFDEVILIAQAEIGPPVRSPTAVGVYTTPNNLDILKDFFPNVGFWIEYDQIPDSIENDLNKKSLNICRF